MSLTQALTSAISGLQANQASLALVSSNVANANTPGYIRKTISQTAMAGSGGGISVNVVGIQREFDQYVQRQLRVESSGAAFADLRAQFYNQIQSLFGTPGASSSLESIYNSFTTALQALSTSPDDGAARSAVIGAAQQLATQLNQMSGRVQSLRATAELGLADSVATANEAMRQIAELNKKIAASSSADGATATMMDQRDRYIDQLAQLMDINVVQGSNNQVTVFTNSGIQLVGNEAAQIAFDARGSMTPASQWSADPSQRSVGTLTLLSPNGGSIDLIQSNAIRSGQIAAYIQMRDHDLVQAQSQLDAIAAGMAAALSNTTTAGSAVTSGAQSGFDIDVSGLSAGNTVTINYTDQLTNTARSITLVRVNDPSALPLSGSAAGTANDKVYGIDFSGGMGSVLAQINQAIASTGLVASNPSGNTLRVLDDGAGNRVDVNGVSKTTTATGLAGGSSELPFFTDGDALYTAAVSAYGAQTVGFAGRITVNSALVADPSQLVAYAAGIAAGDNTRPNFIYEQLTTGTHVFSGNTGIGTAAAPFTGSISTFLRQVINTQGEAANSANSLKQGQDVVMAALEQTFNEGAAVNVDAEMANLITLQNAYAANAQVLSAVKNLFDVLLRM
ncbi:MAG: flagellar hook-associated protein FlgK [Bradyrhizobium sp.]|nr:flagellar hook-associated protein FlgK [Bradyrhizobium sp.]